MKCISCKQANVTASKRCANCARRFLRLLDAELKELEEQAREPEVFDGQKVKAETARLLKLRADVALDIEKENQ